MRIKNRFQFCCFIVVILLISCKKVQPKLSNTKKGCECENEVSADFEMRELERLTQFNPVGTDTDSIFGDKNVWFIAKENNANYTWYIGAELLNEQKVGRYFPNSMVGQRVPITLVVRKKPNKICFPTDDGFDSIRKYLTVAKTYWYDDFDSLRFCGTFKVKSPLLTDSVEIKIESVKKPLGRYINVYNFDGKGSNCVNVLMSSDIGCNYKQLFIIESADMKNKTLRGDVLVKSDNSAELNFITGDYIDGSYLEDIYYWKFKGRKIQ